MESPSNTTVTCPRQAHELPGISLYFRRNCCNSLFHYPGSVYLPLRRPLHRVQRLCCPEKPSQSLITAEAEDIAITTQHVALENLRDSEYFRPHTTAHISANYRISSNSSRPSNRPRPRIDLLAKYSAPSNRARSIIKAYVITQSEQDQAKCCLVGHILRNHQALLRHEDFQKLALLP